MARLPQHYVIEEARARASLPSNAFEPLPPRSCRALAAFIAGRAGQRPPRVQFGGLTDPTADAEANPEANTILLGPDPDARLVAHEVAHILAWVRAGRPDVYPSHTSLHFRLANAACAFFCAEWLARRRRPVKNTRMKGRAKKSRGVKGTRGQKSAPSRRRASSRN